MHSSMSSPDCSLIVVKRSHSMGSSPSGGHISLAEMTIISAKEICPPEGEEPIEWLLLTTIKLQSGEDIEECIKWYCLRWRIEDWHRVLKSGCKIQDLANKTAERLI